MDDQETAAVIWTLIAVAHAEAAELEVQKAEILYAAHPNEYRRRLVQFARVTTGFAYVIASEANQSLIARNYEATIVIGQQSYAFLNEVKTLSSLAETDNEDRH